MTIDCTALCLKSGNAIVLRGSSTAAHSNAVLAAGGAEAVGGAGLPDGAVVAGRRRRPRRAARARHPGRPGRPDHPARRRGPEEGAEGARDRAGDLRGGRQLPRLRRRDRRPRRCACAIALNAKVQRPGVCNAAETLLVHADVAAEFLPRVLGELRECRRRAARGRAHAGAAPGAIGDSLVEATEEDWATEYLALMMAVKVVDRVEEAIEHVNRYGTGHSEAIVTGSTDVGAGVHERRRRGLRVRERLDALHRRRRVRHGRRDRQLHAEAARARPDRAARADHLQVRGRGLRPGARVAGLRVGISAEPSTRRTSGTWSARRRRSSQLELDRVVLMPVGEAPHREIEQDPGAEARLEMCELAVGGRRALRGVADRDRPGGPVLHGRHAARSCASESPGRRAVPDPRRGPGGGAARSWHEPEKVLELATHGGVRARRAAGRNAIGIKLGAAAGRAERCASSTCRGSTCRRRRSARAGASTGSRSGTWCRTGWPTTSPRKGLYGAGTRRGGRDAVHGAEPPRTRPSAGGAHRGDRLRQEGARHPRARPARDRRPTPTSS